LLPPFLICTRKRRKSKNGVFSRGGERRGGEEGERGGGTPFSFLLLYHWIKCRGGEKEGIGSQRKGRRGRENRGICFTSSPFKVGGGREVHRYSMERGGGKRKGGEGGGVGCNFPLHLSHKKRGKKEKGRFRSIFSQFGGRRGGGERGYAVAIYLLISLGHKYPTRKKRGVLRKKKIMQCRFSQTNTVPRGGRKREGGTGFDAS